VPDKQGYRLRREAAEELHLSEDLLRRLIREGRISPPPNRVWGTHERPNYTDKWLETVKDEMAALRAAGQGSLWR
jgi:hypothetical protein